MAQYSIGEVEKISGIKSHILRYWEEVMPFICPRKDTGGRRVYSQRDLDTILRLKFLIYEKKYTIEGAQNQILSEVEEREKNAETLMQINEVRTQLQELLLLASNKSRETNNE